MTRYPLYTLALAGFSLRRHVLLVLGAMKEMKTYLDPPLDNLYSMAMDMTSNSKLNHLMPTPKVMRFKEYYHAHSYEIASDDDDVLCRQLIQLCCEELDQDHAALLCYQTLTHISAVYLADPTNQSATHIYNDLYPYTKFTRHDYSKEAYQIANEIHEADDWSLIGILADKLEDEKANKTIINHLRRVGHKHYRGCKAVDHVLGFE